MVAVVRIAVTLIVIASVGTVERELTMDVVLVSTVVVVVSAEH